MKKKSKRSSAEERQFDKLFKYIPAQRATIAKNRGSVGWGKGYTATYGARKALRKLKRNI